MRQLSFVVAAVIVCAGVWLSAAAAQVTTTTTTTTQRTWQVQNGNTTILFEPANGQDLNMAELQAFGQLADNDPAMARSLARNPSLIENENFVGRHPQLQQFLVQYPNAREHFLADPGNFVVPVNGSRWSKAVANRANDENQ
ncbi:MAG TPA: hypothetical protein VMB26_10470 [Candidatus Binataceae bacterium]|nr:hypothetical protein [Candidatus Binataceae bacterium]